MVYDSFTIAMQLQIVKMCLTSFKLFNLPRLLYTKKYEGIIIWNSPSTDYNLYKALDIWFKRLHWLIYVYLKSPFNTEIYWALIVSQWSYMLSWSLDKLFKFSSTLLYSVKSMLGNNFSWILFVTNSYFLEKWSKFY